MSQYPGDIIGLSGLGLGLRIDALGTPRTPARFRMLLGNALAMIKCRGPIKASPIIPRRTLSPCLCRVIDMSKSIIQVLINKRDIIKENRADIVQKHEIH